MKLYLLAPAALVSSFAYAAPPTVNLVPPNVVINASPGTFSGTKITTSTDNPDGFTFSENISGIGGTANVNSETSDGAFSFAESQSGSGAISSEKINK
jgi:hypothetical protein